MFSTKRQGSSRDGNGSQQGNNQSKRDPLIPATVTRKALGVTKVAVATGLVLTAGFLWSNLSSPLTVPSELHQPSKVVVDNTGRPLSVLLNNQGKWRYPISPSQIPEEFERLVLGHYDSDFYDHFGFSPVGTLCSAVVDVVSDNSSLCGKSINTRLAQLLYPDEGNWMNWVRSVQLELQFDKPQILALFVNYLPLTEQIEGVQAGSYQFFDRPIAKLEPAEAALLLAVAQAPKTLRLDKFPERARQQRDAILDQLAADDFLSHQQLSEAKALPVNKVSLTQPARASQFSQLVAPRSADEVINSAIDPLLQQELERYAAEFADKQVNGSTMAMVMVDNASKQVIAYVGNSPGHDTTDMVQAVRSPGDMYKPMLFAKALDERLIHSESLLADIPRKGYLREVADGLDEFIGPVSASEALQQSLNLPFVQLIENYGERKFLQTFEKVGQPLNLSDFELSPRVVLGEAETNLAQMVTMYAALASDGEVAPIQYLPSEPTDPKRYMSRESAWITWNSLREAKVPSFVETQQPEVLAWKSGNGWAGRDNWSIGVTPEFTLGVWVGVHDDIYSSPVSGKADSLSALVTITDALKNYRNLGDMQRPRGVKQAEICWPDGRTTGVNTSGCDLRKIAWTKNGSAPQTLKAGDEAGWFRSKRGMYVDRVTEKRLSRGCYKNRAEYETAVLWPHVLEPWLPEQMRRAQRMPAFNDYCPNIPWESSDLKLTGIKPDQTFYRIKGERMPALEINVTSANGTVEWYLNGEAIADGNKVEINLNRLINGPQQLVALDEQGVSLQIPFNLAPASDRPQQPLQLTPVADQPANQPPAETTEML
ncbi:transglycosylase domain-containing protein [Ferrimonas senticii]|uniref:transglycosylase domain-containing protein n=1 Tax=Ferrimonas senticii TaxID=394566 RepID=UPI00041AA812|nr:transglycosylase domain-containing protein [Ferrimonas senticii]